MLARIQMVLNGAKMNIDCLGKTQPLDRLMLKGFAPCRERGQQGAAKRQQNENRGGRAQYRGRETFFAWFNHARPESVIAAAEI